MRLLALRTTLPAIAALLAPLLAACGGDEAAEVEKAGFQIAFVSEAGDGTAARRGIDLALDELNADSASHFRYSVTAADAGIDAAGAAAACQRLAGVEGLDAIVGSQSDAGLAACVRAPGVAGVPYISIAESSGELCAANLYLVAPLPNQRAAAEETAREIAANEPGTITVSDYFETVQLPGNERFLAGVRGRDPAGKATPEAARAYDAVHLLAAAVEAAGSTDRAAVLQALPGAKFDGPRGEISFPPGGHFATLNLFIGRTGPDGAIEPVSLRPTIPPKPACG